MPCPACASPTAPGDRTCKRCGLTLPFSVSRPLPAAGQIDSCRICGHPLGGRAACEMCGSPAIATSSGADVVRCPLCGVELGESMTCSRCGALAAGGERPDAPGFQCPRCSSEISLDVESCPRCGVRIWMNEAAEAARLETLKCPACGAPLAGDEHKCEKCGFLVWLESEDDRKERASAKIKEAMSSITAFRDRFGSPPERAVTYLEAAQRVLENGEVDLALRRALIAAEIAETDSRQRIILLEAEKRAEDRLRSAEEMGGDVARCRELLDLSRKANEKGDYKVAIRLALKCKILAEGIESSLSRAPLGM